MLTTIFVGHILPEYYVLKVSGFDLKIKDTLARIFHTNLLRKPGSLMDAALDSHFDLGSMDTYSPASKCSSALPHQTSRLPRHD